LLKSQANSEKVPIFGMSETPAFPCLLLALLFDLLEIGLVEIPIFGKWAQKSYLVFHKRQGRARDGRARER
jgi:hypothetical protein